jgi:hypothetical protein
MPRYEVIQPIEHDGKRAESGFIELTEAEAAPLLAIGHIGATRPRAARSSVQPLVVQTPVQTAAAAPQGGSESEGEGGGDGSGEGEGGEGGEGAGGSEGGA